MDIQVLIATMNQTGHNLLEKMNIQTNAIVGNQCDTNQVENFEWNGHKIKWMSFAERGVGLNRNNALMRAASDLVIFADDDMVYADGYADIVKKTFDELSDADVIIFNVNNKNKSRRTVCTKVKRLHWYNVLRYPTYRIAARLPKIRISGIMFNQCFGGGTEHSCGEDTLFLTSCLKAGLKIYAVPETIANMKCERESTWFRGYTDKYMRDKGVLYRVMSRRFWKLLCLQDALRHGRLYQKKWTETYKNMIAGGREYT